MVAADDTAHRLAQGSLKKALSFIWHQAAQLHDFMREDAVGAGSAEILIRISWGSQASFVIQGWLLGKLHARLKLILPFLAYLHDNTCKFMADNDGVGVNILRRALMLFALFHQLVGGHADAVAYYLCQNLILFYWRQFKFLQPQISGSIHSDCFCLHNQILLPKFLICYLSLHLFTLLISALSQPAPAVRLPAPWWAVLFRL